MKAFAATCRRLRGLNLPGALFLVLLQRAPTLQVVAGSATRSTMASAGSVLRSIAATAATLGAVHSLAGATQFFVSSSAVSGTTGTAVASVAFAVTGATVPPGSYRIANLPPGVTVPGASGGVLNASSGSISGTPTTAGTFAVSITSFQFSGAQGDSFGPATVVYSITAGATAPVITTSPASQSASAGTTVSFTSAASGTPVPAFQWRKNGANISGATQTTLTLSNLQTTDAATYSVVATNGAGTATSAGAVLTVLAAPTITAHPVGATITAGTAVTLTGAATGTPPPVYQWRKNGIDLSSATQATLVLASAQLADTGTYSLVATNSVGTAASNGATLTILVAPTFAIQPASQSVGVGTNVSLQAAANGVPAPTLQWRKNGTAISGATDATLTLSNVQPADAGTYAVVALNSAGSLQSSAATLTVTAGPGITAQPADLAVNPGATAAFFVAVTGTPAPTLQWFKNGTALAGVTGTTLTLSNVQPGDAATYSLVATNSAGTTTSNAAVLTLNVAPTITTQPSNQTVGAGRTALFAVSATGSDPLSYQWFKDGVSLGGGATGASLTLSNVQSADAGSYRARITNPAGTITSANVVLTIAAADPGRIVNLSILATVTAAEPSFTMGAVVGGSGTSGVKPLLVRVVGPSLAAFGVADPLADPDLAVLNGQTQVAANDNWATGGVETLGTAFAQVGAFAFASSSSRDAALTFSPAIVPPTNFSVLVRANGTVGTVLAELYDATPGGASTATTPRLINVSVLKQIAVGGTLTAGFAIGGTTARQVLVRAIGPTLGTAFGVGNAMADPKIDLFDGSQKNIATNDNWGGRADLAAAFASVGAFELPIASKDAALVVLLAPGSYTAQVGGTGGLTLVEVYEVP